MTPKDLSNLANLIMRVVDPINCFLCFAAQPFGSASPWLGALWGIAGACAWTVWFMGWHNKHYERRDTP